MTRSMCEKEKNLVQFPPRVGRTLGLYYLRSKNGTASGAREGLDACRLARNAPVAVPFFCGRMQSRKKFGTVPPARMTRIIRREQCVKSMRCFGGYSFFAAGTAPFFLGLLRKEGKGRPNETSKRFRNASSPSGRPARVCARILPTSVSAFKTTVSVSRHSASGMASNQPSKSSKPEVSSVPRQ